MSASAPSEQMSDRMSQSPDTSLQTMDCFYQYPVFFACPRLDREQKKRVEKYFKIRRKSGGGECGSIQSVYDRVYSIAFKDHAAQQRILQQCEHVLDGPLVLTVRGSSSPITSSSTNQSVGPKLGFTAPAQQSQQPILAPSLPLSGGEYELQLDTYLLHYLKDCPRAEEELQEELTSVACSAQLYPEEGRVLVSRSQEAGAVADWADREGVKQWQAVADKIFDKIKERYLCHFEVDAHKVKVLLRSCSSHQAVDEVKVYSQVGLAIVVGEHSQVHARLREVEDLCVQSQRSGIVEKKKTIRRLGEAKLRLLWKEIEQSLGCDVPGVKVKQGDTGQLVLEGSVEEIVKAGNWITEKENLVVQQNVSDISLRLLAFLSKVYEGPGVLCDFLGIDGKVEIELGNTQLRIFALCAAKLDETEKALRLKFKEVKVDVPDCPDVPSELKLKLESKANEMNQGKGRSVVRFISGGIVHLLGHTKEVEELNEIIAEFILDQSGIETTVHLPFPELADFVPHLMQLHGYDHSGVTFYPSNSSSSPVVMLRGPSSSVTQVRIKLCLLLDTIVQERVTIDLPAAVKYFQSPQGKEKLLHVGHSHRCVVQLQEHATRQHWASREGLCKGGTTIASYCLHSGLQVLICQGDITKEHADALVNAANASLEHGGGVAAALSHAGGPQVQKECRNIIRQVGKIATGGAVVTTGGNLNCKVLLHAVGPVAGQAGGNERSLLEKAVQSALELAETMEFKSIAIPCISSGLFGIPIRVCADAIVTAVKKFGSQGDRSLCRVILIDTRGEAVRDMQDACDRLLQGTATGSGPSGDVRGAAAADTLGGAAADGVKLEILQGVIEKQQVDVLVSPMVGHDPLSTRVGHTLEDVVGSQLSACFHRAAGGVTLPGDAVLLEALPGLPAKAVLFLNLMPWDNNQDGVAVKCLRQGFRKILASCDNRGVSSVALPALGTGTVLCFPHTVVARALLEEIQAFEQTRTNRTPFLVRIIIHPSDKDSSKAFQSAQETVRLKGFTNDAHPDQASFYRHVSSTYNEVTVMLGEVTLQMVCGDIIHERTDVIVNTTDFKKPSGVCKAILTAAGADVQAEFTRMGVPADHMCTTGPGSLDCREIIHAMFMGEVKTIQKHCKNILKQCERKGHRSAAFPAINTGEAGLDYVTACKAMLDGMAQAIGEMKPTILSLIRIVFLQQKVFHAFRSELGNRLGQVAPRPLTLKEKAKQILKKCLDFASGNVQDTRGLTSITVLSWKPQPAELSVIGCNSDTIRSVKSDLERILSQMLVEKEVELNDFSRLDEMELEAVQVNVRMLGISLERRRRGNDNSGNGNRGRAEVGSPDQAGSGGEVYVLRGLREDVLSVGELVNKALQNALRGDLQDKEKAMLALSVQWSLQDPLGAWQELSLHENYVLEQAHQRKAVSREVEGPNRIKMIVNLRAHQATDLASGCIYKVNRSETETAIELPTHWEPMHREIFKKVEVHPNTQEHQEVSQGFLKTINQFTIRKIERVQNLYLWQAFALCRKRIVAKNGSAELGEMMLYHGTSERSCSCIERDRFDRSYAGTHGAMYGQGVYFAVDANYSAVRYSPPDTSGLKRLYVARVLTGRYTVGNNRMRTPPPRAASDPTDCFDSLVDNQQQPTIFVIFHDDQAYPEYLITFS